jgi:ribosomal protein S18 acetylase RimI-like enzyme
MDIETHTIKVENAPKIPGLTFRGFRGAADYPIMAGIVNAANRADQVDGIITAETVEQNYAHMNRLNADRDMLFTEIGGQAVGYGRCTWAIEHSGNYQYSFNIFMSSDGRLPGLGEAVVAYFMQHLREIAAGHPADAPKVYISTSNSDTPWYTNLLKSHNFEIVRYGLHMARPCNQPVEVTPLPEGIEVRTPTPEEYRKVWEANNEAFSVHWGQVKPNEQDYQTWLNFPHSDPAIWKVAWEGAEVAGMVLNFINQEENERKHRKRGYTESISVRQPWRRRGIARALLTRSIQMFQEMGMEETALGVDTENPTGAKQLYESVGYMEEKRFMFYQKPFSR